MSENTLYILSYFYFCYTYVSGKIKWKYFGNKEQYICRKVCITNMERSVGHMLFNMKKFILSKINGNVLSIIFTLILGITFVITHPEYSKEFTDYIKAFFEIILICILILSRHKIINNLNIPHGKTYLYAWLVSLILPLIIQALIHTQNVGKKNKIIAEILIFCSLFIILRLFKIEITKLNFKLSLKTFLLSLSVGLGYIILTSICESISGNSIKNLSFSSIVFYLIQSFAYVAFFEETTCRGLLMGGLKSYRIPDYLINIIQAIIFGFLHCPHYSSFGIKTILSTSYQMIFGYFVGLIYLRTKSLMPGIIIHALFDFGVFIYL